MDERVRVLIASTSRLALRDPDAALRLFVEATALGELAGSEGLAQAFEAMGRVAIACRDHATARDALAMAEHEALLSDDALLAARSRATLVALDRLRPYGSSAEALAAEIRHTTDLLEASQTSTAGVPALHAAQARVELRRRLAGPRGLPAIGRLEVALALTALEVAVLVACAVLTLESDVDALLPSAVPPTTPAAWAEQLATWLAPGFEVDGEIDVVLERLVIAGLIEHEAARPGRPRLAPDVESLLVGRGQALLPASFHRAIVPPIWREAPPRVPLGPTTPPRILVLLGDAPTATDHLVHLAWAYGWPLWLATVSASPPAILLRDLHAAVREALVYDKLLGLVVHALDPETVRLLVVEAAALLERIVVITSVRPSVPDAFAVVTIDTAEVAA
ncbi:MAG: hypothetical protein NT062_11435 [Proteobacteria bacterium]|nr:hypothetical protein [Pseudomonadota bacterium]